MYSKSIGLLLPTSLMLLVACTPRLQAPSVSHDDEDSLPSIEGRAAVNDDRPLIEHHLELDFEQWALKFPIESFEKKNGPRQFSSTEAGDPLDLWKARGEIVTSPAHLCAIELVRRQAAETHDLGPAIPVDIILWSTAPPLKPYQTKLGGVPHREADKPWPTNDEGVPYTFVAQFCFTDSKDIVSEQLPDDVMLVFFENADSIYMRNIEVEWSAVELKEPVASDRCPAPSFVVPELSGAIHRSHEYPESGGLFEDLGHYQHWLFATTQSTKIGSETYFIQHDPRWDDEDLQLICALNSIHPKSDWPFINCEKLPPDADEPDTQYEWGKYRMMFADVGCLYFLLDDDGNLVLHFDSY